MYQALKLAQQQLDAYNRRDIDAFAACYAEDIELIDHATGELFCKGKEALRQRYGALFAEKHRLQCRLVKRIVCGDFAFDEEEVEGLVEGRIIHAVAIYEVKDEQIRRAWFVRE